METIVVAIISSVVSPILVLWVKYAINKRGDKKIVANIREHALFFEMKYMRNFMIPKICIEKSAIKTKILKRFLEIKFDVIEKHLDKLTQRVINNEQLTLATYSNVIVDMVMEYETNAIEAGIPEIFVQKFSDWHTPKIHIIKDVITNVYQSGLYSTQTEIHSAFLDTIKTILHLTLLDASSVISKMNGELEAAIKKNDTQLYL